MPGAQATSRRRSSWFDWKHQSTGHCECGLRGPEERENSTEAVLPNRWWKNVVNCFGYVTYVICSSTLQYGSHSLSEPKRIKNIVEQTKRNATPPQKNKRRGKQNLGVPNFLRALKQPSVGQVSEHPVFCQNVPNFYPILLEFFLRVLIWHIGFGFAELPFFGWNILIVFKEFLLLNDTGYVHIEIDPFTVSTSRFSDKDPTAHKQWLAFGVDFARLRGASQLIIVSSRNPWFFKLGKGSELKIGNADLMGSSASLFSLFSKVSIECEALHSKLQSFCVMLLCGRSISHSQCDFQVFVCQSESLVHFKMWWLDVQVWYSKWKQCAATFSEWGFSCDVTHVHTSAF